MSIAVFMRNVGLMQVLLVLGVLLPLRTHGTETLRVDGSTGVKPLVMALAQGYQQVLPEMRIEIGAGLKPDARVNALISGQIDIAMASHGLDHTRISAAGMKVHNIARVAVVMGVQKQADVDRITHEQLCAVYRGDITNWQALGGANLPVRPFIRPFDEVDTEVILGHIACFRETAIPAHIEIRKKSGQMARALSQIPGAIGMTTMVRVAQSKGQITALFLNDISPVTSNVSSGRYPLSRDVFLITPVEMSEEVAGFLAFIRSPAGADILRVNNAAPAE